MSLEAPERHRGAELHRAPFALRPAPSSFSSRCGGIGCKEPVCAPLAVTPAPADDEPPVAQAEKKKEERWRRWPAAE